MVMRKILSIITLSAICAVGAFAQQQTADGNMQASVVLGSNPMFYQSTSYLLPGYTYGGYTTTGLNETPSYYLNLGNVGSNSLTNMIGVQFAYFLTPSIDVNAMFSMNISATPKKDYSEGVGTHAPASNRIDGELKSNWYANVGANYRFKTQRVSPYAGARLGGQMGRIQTKTAYNGNVENQGTFVKFNNAGQIWSLQGALVAGVDCVLNCGVVLGLEVMPVSYQYSVIEIDPSGSHNYHCDHHSIKIFSTPTLKLGFRF